MRTLWDMKNWVGRKFLCRQPRLYPLSVCWWLVENIICPHRLLTDLAGHERYLKTTLYGLTSGAPSCIILIVGANAGLIGMSKEHLAIALALGIPVAVCITKVSSWHISQSWEIEYQYLSRSIWPQHLSWRRQLNRLQEHCRVQGVGKCSVLSTYRQSVSYFLRKTPVFVKSTETSIELATSFGSERWSLFSHAWEMELTPLRICPVFQTSNVTGEGLDYVGISALDHL